MKRILDVTEFARVTALATVTILAAAVVSLTARSGHAQTGWHTQPGCARSIALTPNYDVWVIGCTRFGVGGYGIYKLDRANWHQDSWVRYPGAAVQIATSTDTGNPWVINSQGSIYDWNRDVGAFLQRPGCARAIGVGPGDRAWVIGCTSTGDGNYEVFVWMGAYWQDAGGAGTQIAVDQSGIPYVVTAQGVIWKAEISFDPLGNLGAHWVPDPGGAPCAVLIATGGPRLPSVITECQTNNVYLNEYLNGWTQYAGPAKSISATGGFSGTVWLVAPNGNICYRDDGVGDGWCNYYE